MHSASGFSRLGVALCLAAGVAFAVQPVLGSLALDRGAEIVPMLGWRYLLAAVVLAVVARRGLRAMPWRVGLAAFGLGLVLYTADSFLFYAALERTSAPFATLLHYGQLAIVVGASAFLGRERLDAKRLAALVGILSGIALVGGGAVSPDALGVTFALVAAAIYAIYILVCDRLLPGVDPIAYSALLTAGAAVAFLVIGGAQGSLSSLGGGLGIGAIVGGALLGSAFALTAFLAGIRLVGPGTASLLVTVEVPVGLVLAGVLLHDTFAPLQLGGAALVVSAIALLQLPRGSVALLAARASALGGRMWRRRVTVAVPRAADVALDAG
jgi:drug/metabolite transporter (DMT)-like permease